MADLSSLLNPAPSGSASPPTSARPPSLDMDGNNPQHKRKDSITSPGLDALAAAASSSARLVSPTQHALSPPTLHSTLGNAYANGTTYQSGLEQLGEAAAMKSEEQHTPVTAQIAQPLAGPEESLSNLAVPDTQSEQVQVKTELGDAPMTEAQRQADIALSDIKPEGSSTPSGDTKFELPTKPTAKPKAPPKKRAAPRKGTATNAKGPAAKKRKLDPNDSVEGSPSRATPASRASGTPVPKGANRKAGSATPTRSSSVAIPDDEDEASDSDSAVFCICRKPDDHSVMIGCEGPCEDWFHINCVKMTEAKTKLVSKWYCPACTEKGHVTMWRRMCRLPDCEWPVREEKARPVSKYCCDEHGEEFMRRLAFPNGVGAGVKDDYIKPPASSGTRKKSQAALAAAAAAAENAEEKEVQGESRGGVLRPSELKAVVDSLDDVAAFHRLGQGIPSPPPTTNGDTTQPIVNGKSEISKTLPFTPDDLSELANIGDRKAKHTARLEMLLARDTFVTICEARHKSVWAQMKAAGETGKDICGYDSRLTWSDEEFEIWRHSPVGKEALESGILPSPSALVNGNTEVAGSAMINGNVEREEEELGKGLCKKKRCERHRQWFKNQQQDNAFEKNSARVAVRKCEVEERGVRDRVRVRVLEGQVEDVVGDEVGGTGGGETNGKDAAAVKMNGTNGLNGIEGAATTIMGGVGGTLEEPVVVNGVT